MATLSHYQADVAVIRLETEITRQREKEQLRHLAREAETHAACADCRILKAVKEIIDEPEREDSDT